MVLLVVLRHFDSFAAIVDVLDDLREVRRAIEPRSSQSMLVSLLNAVDAVALWREHVAVESKLVPSSPIAIDVGAEAVSWNHLVLVVILENISHRSERLQVLISARIIAVQRVRLAILPVRRGKVNGYTQAQLASAEDVLEEVDDGLELKVVHDHSVRAYLELLGRLELIN